jgi:hypothetical protein
MSTARRYNDLMTDALVSGMDIMCIPTWSGKKLSVSA